MQVIPSAERAAVGHHSVPANSIVASLPHDVLRLIFTLGVPEVFPLRFTQICRHWRAVATECAFLWTDIPHNRLLLRLFFERSQRKPVHLRVGHDYGELHEPILPTDVVTAELITPNLHRVASIKIIGWLEDPDDEVIRSWMSYLSEHGPLDALRSLDVELDDQGEPTGEFLQYSQEEAQSFGRIAPSLRHLTLNGVYIPPCDLYNDLSSLVILCVHGVQVSLQELLQLLGRSQHLTSLELCDIWVTELDHTPPAIPPFHLLTDFEIHRIHIPEMVALFRRLVLSRGITRFSYTAASDVGHGPLKLRMPPQKLDPSISIQCLKFLGSYDNYDRGYNPYGCHALISRGGLAPPAPHIWDFSDIFVSFELEEAPPVQTLIDLVRWLSPNIATAEGMHVGRLLSPIRTRTWRSAVLARMPRLKAIRIDGCYLATVPLFMALSASPLADGLDGALPLCLELRTVEVTGFLSSKGPGGDIQLGDSDQDNDHEDGDEDEAGSDGDEGVETDEDIETDEVNRHPDADRPDHSDEESGSGEDDESDEDDGLVIDDIGELPHDGILAELFWEMLHAMVTTRHAQGVPLESVLLSDVPRPPDDAVLDTIRAMVLNTFEARYAV